MGSKKKPDKPAPPRMFVTGEGFTIQDLVPGNSIRLRYTISKMVARSLQIEPKGTVEFRIDSVKDSPLSKEARDVRGSFPKFNLRGEGGLSLNSQLGWMFLLSLQ